MRKRLFFSFLFTILLAACQSKGSPDLVQAADVIEEALRPVNLSRSMYAAAFPDGTPTQFIRYYFSDMGTAEWPPSEETATELEREQMEAIRGTLWPAGVGISAFQPNPARGRQIVLTADDDREMVIIQAFAGETSAPVFIREVKLPNVEPAPGVAEIYQINLEEGLSSQMK